MNKRMNRNKLNIGVYYLKPYVQNEQNIKELAECGIDFVTSMNNDPAILDLFVKYGVGAFVNDAVPNWWGGNGKTAGTLSETYPMEMYEESAKKFVDHPAIWGVDIGDEPSALDFPYYGKVYNKVETLFQNQFVYINLYPNYASTAENSANETECQLGTATYEEHIAKYCECVPADYISYDFYPYAINFTKFYENFRIVSEACRKTGRSMWIVLQVNSNRENEKMSLNNLRIQAFASMAFGAENITWACYGGGWWHHNVYDDNGNKTEQYDKLKEMNWEIRTIADEYMRYRNVSTHFVGFGADHPDMAAVNQAPIDALNTGIFFDVKADNGAPILVGEMVSREQDHAHALMICAADDHHEKNPASYNIVFRVMEGQSVKAVGGKGAVPVIKLEDGSYSVAISSNEGVLITAR